MKKRLPGILAGVLVLCITYIGTILVNNDAPISEMQNDAPVSETPVDYGVRIISVKPISKAEIMKKYWSGVKEGGKEYKGLIDNELTETDGNAVKIVSVEPISSEKIQENINNCTNDDTLTDPEAHKDNTPTSAFDLTTDIYEKPFDFESYIYTDKFFTTPHGVIKVIISGDNVLSSSSDTGYRIEQYKKGDSESVSSVYLEYGKEYHLEYPVFYSSDQYYFKLSKTSSDSYVNGTIWVG